METRETLEERSFPIDFAALFPILLSDKSIVIRDVLEESAESIFKVSPMLFEARLR